MTAHDPIKYSIEISSQIVKQSLEAEGVTMAFWKIAMRPGKPIMHGRLGAMRVIGLPGNPVASYVCGLLFLVPLIRALSGARVQLGRFFRAAWAPLYSAWVWSVFGLVGIVAQVVMMRIATLVLGIDMNALFRADEYNHEALMVAAAQFALGIVVAVAIL